MPEYMEISYLLLESFVGLPVRQFIKMISLEWLFLDRMQDAVFLITMMKIIILSLLFADSS